MGGSDRTAALQAVAARGVSILAAFLLSVLVSRTLTPEAAGTFFLVYAIVALGATVGRFGTDNLALRMLGGDSSSPLEDVRLLTRIALTAAVATTLLTLPVTLLVVDGESPLALAVAVSGVLPQALSVLAGAYLRGMGRMTTGVLAELGSLPALGAAAMVAINLLAPGGLALDSALMAFGVASWASAAWSLPLALRTAAHNLDAQGSTEDIASFFRRHHRKLAAMTGTSTLVYGVVWAPIFVLGMTSTGAQVAFYTVAMRLANIVSLVPSIQVSYLSPEFARRFYADDLTGLNAITARSVGQAAAITLLPIVVLVSAAPWVVALLFGEAFIEAAPLVVILCVATFVAMLFGQVNQLMLLCGLEHTALLLSSGLLVVWATLGLWLGANYGATGVAWIAAGTTVTYPALAAKLLKRRMGIKSYLRLARFAAS